MPYITQDRRRELDPCIEKLQKCLLDLGLTAGDLNYTITRLVAFYFRKERRYATIAKVTGILDNVKSEFYRRLASKYENIVHARNGDVEEFIVPFKD